MEKKRENECTDNAKTTCNAEALNSPHIIILLFRLQEVLFAIITWCSHIHSLLIRSDLHYITFTHAHFTLHSTPPVPREQQATCITH